MFAEYANDFPPMNQRQPTNPKTPVMRHSILAAIFVTVFAVAACAQSVPVAPKKQTTVETEAKPQPTPRLPADPSKFAVILTGISGEELYAKQFAKWTTDLRTALIEKLGFAEDHVTVLTEKPSEKEQRCSAEVVRETFVKLRNTTKPDHQVFLFFIGHGSFDGKIAKFNLAGPDLSASDYAQLISPLPSRQVVIVNMASASGEFIKPLSGDGRIIITATRSGMEQNAPRFGQYFIAALGNPEADGDKNGRVSVLEAFQYATKLTGDAFKQKGTLVTEHSLLDDDGDGKGSVPGASSTEPVTDGVLAKTTYFDSLPKQQAGGDAALAALFSDRMRLEGEIEKLKARKTQLKEDDYDNALEALLVEFAKLSRTIRTKQK